MKTMTRPDTPLTCLADAAMQYGRAVLSVYGSAPQGPVKNRGGVRSDYIAQKHFTAACERVCGTIEQAVSLRLRDRNGSKELAAITRAIEAEEQRLEEQLFTAYVRGLAERAQTMRFKPSTARVPEFQDDETPALYE